MTLKITQVDAFTETPFAGNPAAVCLLPEAREAAWMQQVAIEMNLSETSFLVRGEDAYHLRWFTPGGEVDLCGHATLAAAHVLWEEGHLPSDETARFDTLSGRLEAQRDGEWIAMNFPAEPASEIGPLPRLNESLGADPDWLGANRLDYFAVFPSEQDVRTLAPDFRIMKELGMRGVIVTAPAEPSGDCDFVSRYFAPRFGIDEDPVTGSAHCCLGPYWAQRLGKNEVVGHQVSARGGLVRVRPEGSRVTLLGKAVTVMHGTLTAAAVADPLLAT